MSSPGDALPIQTPAEKWPLVEAFAATHGLVTQHIASYDEMVSTELRAVVLSNRFVWSDADPGFYLEYTDIWVGRPSVTENMMERRVTPNECRLRDLTYSAPIYVSVRYTRGKEELVTERGICIGRLPVMLKSSLCVLRDATKDELVSMNECPMDPGGYFIVRGVERVILAQEQLSKNRIILETDTKHQTVASVTSSTHERKSKTSVILRRNGTLALKHNTFSEDIPVAIVARAMGVETDQELVQMVLGTTPDDRLWPQMLPTLEEVAKLEIWTRDAALEYLGDRIRLSGAAAGGMGMGGGAFSFRRNKPPAPGPPPAKKAGGATTAAVATATTFPSSAHRTSSEEALDILRHVVLAHVPTGRGAVELHLKTVVLAQMIRQILVAKLDPRHLTDKDYYGNKRLEMAGQLLSLLFEDVFKQFNSTLQKMTDNVLGKPSRTLFDVAKTMTEIRHDLITNALVSAISSGNWRLKRFKMERAGVTQVLSRLSFIATIGMLARVQSQFERTRKVSGPRALHPSQWGVLCPADTPEGESCGLIKTLALCVVVSPESSGVSASLTALLSVLGLEDVSAINSATLHDGVTQIVEVNGVIVGVHRDGERLVAQLRVARRRGLIAPTVSIAINDSDSARTVVIATDAGRLCRPLLVVKPDGSTRLTSAILAQVKSRALTFNDLFRTGLLEYLDVNEAATAFIALTAEEIVPGRTTHAEIDPATILGCCAACIPFIHHNQSPRNTYQCAMAKQSIGAVATNQMTGRLDTLLYALHYPQRPIVQTRAVPLVGMDALPAGQNAIIAIVSHSGYDIDDAIVLNKASLDRGFGRCDVVRRHTFVTRYDEVLLEVPDVASVLTHAMPLITKGVPPLSRTISATAPIAESLTIVSQPHKSRNPARVARVLIAAAEEEDQTVIKVLLREHRRPELGDKFSSRHGQKGVVGLIVQAADLPFTEDGIVPDLIMNPHGFPSRMTVGKLLELLAGKAAVLRGELADATAFHDAGASARTNIAAIETTLRACGYSKTGKDILYSGITGRPMPAAVYTGPVYYQRLKHMVADKMHARARGPRALLTRQPTEGRSRDGGLRLGEMERDCLIGYGAAALLLERLMISSDAYVAHVCRKCGMLGHKNWCPYCRRGGSGVQPLVMPYATKLLIQELLAMNIAPRLVMVDE